jgi:hypothetical protein
MSLLTLVIRRIQSDGFFHVQHKLSSLRIEGFVRTVAWCSDGGVA